MVRFDCLFHNEKTYIANRSVLKGVPSVTTKSRTEQLLERLRDLQASSGDVEAAAIVSVDGLSMASSLPGHIEEDRVSAMSAAMVSLGERISSELGRGLLEQVMVKGESGYVILTS